ncbi:MAG: hypothetical protein U1E59_06690 [Amaricoccus sp.]
MARRAVRAKATGIGFLLVWMVLWAAAMVVVVWSLGAAALAGEAAPAVFMVGWLAVAAIGLVSAGRRLVALLTAPDPGPTLSRREHAWDDGIPPPPPDSDGDRASRP